jgi:acyl transferase domain-containing protein
MTSSSAPSGIAIIGIACRFPGAGDHRQYWKNLRAGIESISTLSEEELAASHVGLELIGNPSYVKAASLLPDSDSFDAAFFEYSPQEARLMDPQQRLLLEVAWEAVEDAGYRVGEHPAQVGVFVGTGGVVSSYLVDRLTATQDLPGYTGSLAHLGNDKDFSSTRVSYKLNLTGPSINVQTACSTSLVATHLACQSILSGECDMALAGAGTVSRATARRLHECQRRHLVARRSLSRVRCRCAGNDFRQRRRFRAAEGPIRRDLMW